MSVLKRELPSCRSFFLGDLRRSAMHYYKFNIADYRKDTGHLSTIEHGIYRQLIDWYYLDETPIPLETQVVSRRLRLASEVEILSLKNVLSDYFKESKSGYVHKRIDVDIADYHEQAEKNKNNGKLGGRPKKTQSVISGLPDESQNNPNHKPLTINHKPIDTDAYASLSAEGLPTCPHQDILLLYKKHLPHLTQPRVWEGNRQVVLKSRWIQAAKPSNYSPEGYKTKEDGLKWWDSFFGYIANDSSLANGFKTKDRTWLPDLEWITNATNFAKIIDGKYAK
jgi:uncharacterized protein YdaU (DUF1376 family)